MDTTYLINLLSELSYFLIVFGSLLAFSIFKGRQAVINIIIGLYLALLISLEFPYYEALTDSFTTSQGVAMAKLALFILFTAITTVLCFRIMPDEFRENKFESFGKKFILALAATSLIMIFSFQVLPITEFMSTGTPLQTAFAPTEYFFFWLLLPLAILFVL